MFYPLQMNYKYREVINIIRGVNQGIRRVIKPKKSKYTHWKKVTKFRNLKTSHYCNCRRNQLPINKNSHYLSIDRSVARSQQRIGCSKTLTVDRLPSRVLGLMVDWSVARQTCTCASAQTASCVFLMHRSGQLVGRPTQPKNHFK